MLFSKTLHKGRFLKEVFIGNFIQSEFSERDNNNNLNLENNSFDSQILTVSETSLELFDYFYDHNLQIPFLEPKFNQELFFNILDAKVMDTENFNKNITVVLLSTCGLVVMTYSDSKKMFVPLCSEVLNIKCQERDKLMNLKVDEKYNLCSFICLDVD
jgi:hypothetical protein